MALYSVILVTLISCEDEMNYITLENSTSTTLHPTLQVLLVVILCARPTRLWIIGWYWGWAKLKAHL